MPETKTVKYIDLLGQPFCETGPPNGHNCWTLVQEVGRRAGIAYPDREFVYELAARDDVVHETIHECLIRLQGPRPYCIVAFRLRSRYVTHMGIVLEDAIHFLHCMRKRLVCRERLDNKYWRRKIEGYYGLA